MRSSPERCAPKDKNCPERFVIKDSGFIMDLSTGHSFTANPTGIAMFKALMEGCSREEIVDRVRREFKVDGETVRRDLDAFLLDLKVMHIHED
ncbi:MAG: PqqD family protein [Candidatus Riflebacteria bacterium]|nr:PqqD family protein [Candidatus Riflebacteria bacterium]